MGKTLLFSKPLTCHFSRIPDDFALIANETETISRFKKSAKKEITNNLKKEIKKYNDVDVTIVAGRLAENFCFEKGLFNLGYPPIILLDVEWHWRYRNKISSVLRSIINKSFHNIVARGSTSIATFCEAEIETYSLAYKIPKNKFFWLPYCSDLDVLRKDKNAKDYIFSGGLQDRDYKILFEAIKKTGIPFHIAAPKEYFLNMEVPENVTLLGLLPKEKYYKEMSDAKAVVFSLDTTSENCSLRYPGVVSYVSAMRMGKCVIINDTVGAASYISSGEHGILTIPNDLNSLREAILEVWEDKKLRENLSAGAYQRSHSEFGYDNYFDKISSKAKSIK